MHGARVSVKPVQRYSQLPKELRRWLVCLERTMSRSKFLSMDKISSIKCTMIARGETRRHLVLESWHSSYTSPMWKRGWDVFQQIASSCETKEGPSSGLALSYGRRSRVLGQTNVSRGERRHQRKKVCGKPLDSSLWLQGTLTLGLHRELQLDSFWAGITIEECASV